MARAGWSKIRVELRDHGGEDCSGLSGRRPKPLSGRRQTSVSQSSNLGQRLTFAGPHSQTGSGRNLPKHSTLADPRERKYPDPDLEPDPDPGKRASF